MAPLHGFDLARLLFVSQQEQAFAQYLTEQSLAHFQEQDNIFYRAYPLGLLGLIHLEQGELEAARPLLEKSLAISKKTGWRWIQFILLLAWCDFSTGKGM